MKTLLKTLVATGFVALSLTACPSPNNTSSSSSPNANPTTSSSPGTTSGNLSSKAAFIAYLTCIKTKEPSLEGNVQAHITALANVTEEQWTTTNAAYYVSVAQGYANYGCN